MPLRFVLDENLRGPLRRAIVRHNATGRPEFDATCVGEPPDLPLGRRDETLLEWCEREARILISLDHAALPRHLADRLAAGRHVPGVLLIRAGASIPEVLAALEVIAYAGDAADFRDRIAYIP